MFLDTSADMVRLSDDVSGHIFYYKNNQWIKSAHPVRLPAGWYAGAINLNENNTTNP